MAESLDIMHPGMVVQDRYRLVRPLADGGMGSVWLAKDQKLDADCAVKFVLEERRTDPEVVSRFEREARISARIRSPHVVQVLDYGVSWGRPFIAMEYLEGEDLRMRLARRGVLDVHEAHGVIVGVARALRSAHALGVVHRDLKPENVILVQADGVEIAKVIDFGIAKCDAPGLEVGIKTQAGFLLGSPQYMSPEQARCQPLDHRSDLWSLAVIAFECLTGEVPFRSEVLAQVLTDITQGAIRQPTEVNPALPPAVDIWWQKATQRDPELRFGDAAELANELADALELPRLPVGGSVAMGCISLMPRQRHRSAADLRPEATPMGAELQHEAPPTVAEVRRPPPTTTSGPAATARTRRANRRRGKLGTAWLSLGMGVAVLGVVAGGSAAGRSESKLSSMSPLPGWAQAAAARHASSDTAAAPRLQFTGAPQLGAMAPMVDIVASRAGTLLLASSATTIARASAGTEAASAQGPEIPAVAPPPEKQQAIGLSRHPSAHGPAKHGRTKVTVVTRNPTASPPRAEEEPGQQTRLRGRPCPGNRQNCEMLSRIQRSFDYGI